MRLKQNGLVRNHSEQDFRKEKKGLDNNDQAKDMSKYLQGALNDVMYETDQVQKHEDDSFKDLKPQAVKVKKAAKK